MFDSAIVPGLPWHCTGLSVSRPQFRSGPCLPRNGVFLPLDANANSVKYLARDGLWARKFSYRRRH